ncbi:MAG TPA: hypothetical protein P5313_04275 [Spirochaetia bacterium]|nr:hypothetical protein [Spirochaetales bacterium]HRY79613.1 hypothetical protein [Spirochaetia bacterium]
MPQGLPPDRAPNCLACRHFIVTWEPAYPRGCEVFGIKSRNLPSAEVFAATGLHCPAFEAIEPMERREGPRPGGSGDAGSENGGIWA